MRICARGVLSLSCKYDHDYGKALFFFSILHQTVSRVWPPVAAPAYGLWHRFEQRIKTKRACFSVIPVGYIRSLGTQRIGKISNCPHAMQTANGQSMTGGHNIPSASCCLQHVVRRHGYVLVLGADERVASTESKSPTHAHLNEFLWEKGTDQDGPSSSCLFLPACSWCKAYVQPNTGPS